MKTKHFNKRLSLNKKTVADLNSREMNHVFGGIKLSGPNTCFTYIATCGPDSCDPGYSNCYSDRGLACTCEFPG
ncbi:MAG: class I lanthipeptide [Candidatus Aminicenantes bacterium]|jgi:natural product precursor